MLKKAGNTGGLSPTKKENAFRSNLDWRESGCSIKNSYKLSLISATAFATLRRIAAAIGEHRFVIHTFSCHLPIHYTTVWSKLSKRRILEKQGDPYSSNPGVLFSCSTERRHSKKRITGSLSLVFRLHRIYEHLSGTEKSILHCRRSGAFCKSLATL